jgi:hypothetical protein
MRARAGRRWWPHRTSRFPSSRSRTAGRPHGSLRCIPPGSPRRWHRVGPALAGARAAARRVADRCRPTAGRGAVSTGGTFACSLVCSGFDGCGDLDLQCGFASCSIECGEGACSGAVVECGPGPCSATCAGRPAPTLGGCDASCACRGC